MQGYNVPYIMSPTSSSALGLLLLTSIYGTFLRLFGILWHWCCSIAAIVCLHCQFVHSYLLCVYIKRSSLHIVPNDLLMSFIAGVSFTGISSFPNSLKNFLCIIFKYWVLAVEFSTFLISSHFLGFKLHSLFYCFLHHCYIFFVKFIFPL